MWVLMKPYFNVSPMMWLKSKINALNVSWAETKKPELSPLEKRELNQIGKTESNPIKNLECNLIGTSEQRKTSYADDRFIFGQ